MFVLNEELLHDAKFLIDLTKFCKERGYTITQEDPEIKIYNDERKAEFNLKFTRNLISEDMELNHG